MVYKAWNLIGELATNPVFYWELNKTSISSSSRVVHFSEISKYPDLVKRYQAIMPQYISIVLQLQLFPDGNLVTFKIKDTDLGYSTSRSISFPVAPGSPAKWSDAMNVQKTRKLYTDLDPNDERELRKLLNETTGVSLPDGYNLRMDVKWPDDAINEIAILYDKYEKGIKEPSPLEEVKKKTQETAALPKYTKPDFWGEPAAIPIKVDLDKDLNNATTTEGVVKISGKASGPEFLIKKGKIIAEGYDQEFDVNSSGGFTTQVVLGAGLNKVKLVIGSKVIEQNITLNREPVDLRATLTWNTANSDIDLYITDPEKFTCFYSNKSSSNMRLDVDNTSGYGPENIYVTKVKKGTYTISVKNYSRGEGTEATIYVFINEKLKDMHKVRFTGSGQTITVSNYSF